MKISETISAVQKLIENENVDALEEPLWELTDYINDNISTLNVDRRLRQQISDCLLLGANQILAKLPQQYQAYNFLAASHILNGDIDKACDKIALLIREAREYETEPLSNDNICASVSYFFDLLSDKSQQIAYINSVVKMLEKAVSGMAVISFVKSLDIRLDKEERLNLLSEAISIDGDFIWALLLIAENFYDEQNWKAAIPYYNKCITLGITDSITCFKLAWCYGKIKDYGNEIIAYQKCIEIDPKYPFAMNNLGYAYCKSKDYEKALSCYQKSMQSGCDGTYPYRNYFILLKRLKQFDEATRFFEANKHKLPKSFQKDVDILTEAKNKNGQLPVPAQDADDEDLAAPEPPAKKSSIKKAKDSFLSELRLEEEIEERMNRGFTFFNNLPLRVYDGNDGYGRQYIIPGVGRVDILAVHEENNDFYVIELKKGLGDDEVIGQVSRYMGWVKKNLATDGQNVFGIVCTGQASERLKYAAEANPNIALFDYGIQVIPV